MELSDFYQLMPQKNCGICGYGSCTTFARCVLFEKEDLTKCAWLESTKDIHSVINDIKPIRTHTKHLAVFEPCITDADMVMAEMYLAHREVDYGYLDPLFCDVLPLYFEVVKCSRTLGIGRIEYGGKEILISHTGKLIVRHAESERDALEVADLLSRVISSAVICPCLAPAVECVSGLCTCEECEILEKYSPSAQEMEIVTVPHIHSVVEAFSRMWEGEHTEVEDIHPLKVKAVTLLAHDKGGLILYAVAHHLSLMQEALKEATVYARKKGKQNELVTFMQDACKGSYLLEHYHKVRSYLLTHRENPFFREVHKVIFHARCIGEIKNRFQIDSR